MGARNKGTVITVDGVAGLVTVRLLGGPDTPMGYINPMPPVNSVVWCEDMGDGSWLCWGSVGGTMNIGPYTGKYFWTAEEDAEMPFLFCAGQAVSRTDYAGLFSKISTQYGVGDGSTTFNIPEGRGRVLVALDNMGGSDAGRLTAGNVLGGTGGSEDMQAHTHAWLEGGFSGVAVSNEVLGGGTFGHYYRGSTNPIQSAGTGDDNMPPYILGNLLIHT